MNKFGGGDSMKHFILITAVLILFLSFIQPLVWADDFTKLKGIWKGQEDGVYVTLEFKTQNQLLYNGEAYNYQIYPGVIRVFEEYEYIDYYYTFQGEILLIMTPYGTAVQYTKVKNSGQGRTEQRENQPVKSSPKGGAGYDNWPPPYRPPQGTIDEYNPTAEMMLYKFAGRWDHVTTNTLTNVFLKPDGTYEIAYEAGYSGQFQDQGGNQTGNWGAAGKEQLSGRWRIEGNLREGKLFMMDQNGNENVYPYRVHIQRGEIYWGEYFFNNLLYSVKYIYR
jgi:hypothetical protein